MTREFVDRSGADVVTNLVDVMRQQLQVVEELLQLTIAKREAVLSRQREQIESVVSQQDRLLGQLAQLENRRHAVVVNWARQQTDLDPDARRSPTLDDVLSSLPEQKEGKEIRELADTLSKRLAELDEANKDNAGLLYYSLAVVQTMIGALTGDETRGAIYSPGSGKSAQEQTGKAILDWRA